MPQQNDFELEEIERINANDAEIQIEKELIKIREYQEFIDHRRLWSYVLLGILLFLVLSNLLLIYLVGSSVLILDKELLQVVYISFVFEILGLVGIVVRFLFKSPPELK